MSRLQSLRKSLTKEISEPSVATFNIKNKLKGLAPLNAPKRVDIKKISIEDEDFEQVMFPKESTLIKIKQVDLSKYNLDKRLSPRKVINITTTQTGKFIIDNDRNILIVGEGVNQKEYFLNSLVSSNSKVGQTISKNEAVELANTYLRLGIKPQNKKEVFIKEIRQKIGLPTE